MTDQESTPTSDTDQVQKETTSISSLEYGRRCSEQERRYCEQRVFQKRNMKDSLRAAGSKAKEEYLSKLAWETEHRPHVKEYMEELRGMVSEESFEAYREIVFKTRRAIDSALLGKNPEKAEPLLRLMAEITGVLKPFANGKTPLTTNVLINNESNGGNKGIVGNTLESDLIKFQQLTGVITPSEVIDVVEVIPDAPHK